MCASIWDEVPCDEWRPRCKGVSIQSVQGTAGAKNESRSFSKHVAQLGWLAVQRYTRRRCTLLTQRNQGPGGAISWSGTVGKEFEVKSRAMT